MKLLNATTTQSKTHKKHHNDLQQPSLYQHHLRTTVEDPAKDEEQKAHDIANIPIPVLAILQASASKFTPGMESQLNKSRERIRRTDAAADEAIQIIHSPFSLPPKHVFPGPQRLTLWDWLQAKRINDAQTEVKYEKT